VFLLIVVLDYPVIVITQQNATMQELDDVDAVMKIIGADPWTVKGEKKKQIKIFKKSKIYLKDSSPIAIVFQDSSRPWLQSIVINPSSSQLVVHNKLYNENCSTISSPWVTTASSSREDSLL